VPRDARAVVFTAVAVDPTADGWMTVAPCDEPGDYATVALNVTGRRTTANLTLVATAATSGRPVCSFTPMAAHHVLDVSGWYVAT
jgi:hypothetical protein